MLTIQQDPMKVAYLKLEMAVVVDAGRRFVTSTYNLEGDGPLVATKKSKPPFTLYKFTTFPILMLSSNS